MTAVVLLLSALCISENSAVASELISSHQPIIAKPGDDVILPCQLRPAVSADSDTIMWTKAGLEPKYVHFHRGGRLDSDKQHPSYYLRTRLFMDELPKGNVSMKIFKVKIPDAGLYKCAVSSVKTDASIQLIVGEPAVISAHEHVRVMVGDDAILPCLLHPPVDMNSVVVEWKYNEKVYIFRREDHLAPQENNERTVFFQDEMVRGNISLKLAHVMEDDAGNYTCLIGQRATCSVTLTVEPKDPGFYNRHHNVLCGVAVVAAVGLLLTYRRHKRWKETPSLPSGQRATGDDEMKPFLWTVSANSDEANHTVDEMEKEETSIQPQNNTSKLSSDVRQLSKSVPLFNSPASAYSGPPTSSNDFAQSQAHQDMNETLRRISSEPILFNKATRPRKGPYLRTS